MRIKRTVKERRFTAHIVQEKRLQKNNIKEFLDIIQKIIEIPAYISFGKQKICL